MKLIPAQVLDKEELDRLSVHSVADALRYFSGIQIKDYGGVGGLKTVNIRSLGSQHVGVFYDGMEIGNAQNGTVDLGRFSLDNMEAINMYNGQKSTIFQPAKDYASAGSIYMKSRAPRFDEGKSYSAKFTMKGGSFDLFNPSLLYERSVSDRVSASLSAEYMQSSGEYKFTYAVADGYSVTDIRRNGDLRAMRVEGGLFGSVLNGEWRAKLYLYDSERGYPGASVREEPGVFQNEDRQWDRNIFAQGSWRKNFSRRYNLLLSAKYANDYLRYLSDPSKDTSTMYADNTYIQQTGYLSAANHLIFNKWWSANISLDYLYNTLDADLDNFLYPRRNTLLGAVASSATLARVRLQASLLYTLVADRTIYSGTAADNRGLWTPTVIASYTPFDGVGLDIRAFYKRIFRMPTLNDLYYTTVGNSNLDPEYTTQYNIGMLYSCEARSGVLRSFLIQLDAYYNEVEDKIIAMPTSNQFRWTMTNVGYCEIRGVDISSQLGWQIESVALNMRLNYTYQRAQDFTDPTSEFYGGQIAYVPTHSGSVVVGAAFGKWGVNYSFIYTGERYESSANIAENYSPAWYTHDLSLSREFAIRGVGMRATAEVNNLLNQQYEVVQCYPMPGTNVKFTISVNL
ncbi:MAG: TonB-dependent receptor [Rikenellaceae bacterium]